MTLPKNVISRETLVPVGAVLAVVMLAWGFGKWAGEHAEKERLQETDRANISKLLGSIDAKLTHMEHRLENDNWSVDMERRAWNEFAKLNDLETPDVLAIHREK